MKYRADSHLFAHVINSFSEKMKFLPAHGVIDTINQVTVANLNQHIRGTKHINFSWAIQVQCLTLGRKEKQIHTDWVVIPLQLLIYSVQTSLYDLGGG